VWGGGRLVRLLARALDGANTRGAVGSEASQRSIVLLCMRCSASHDKQAHQRRMARAASGPAVRAMRRPCSPVWLADARALQLRHACDWPTCRCLRDVVGGWRFQCGVNESTVCHILPAVTR